MKKGFYFHFCDKLQLTDKQTKRLILLIELRLKPDEIYSILKYWIKDNNKEDEVKLYKNQVNNFLINYIHYKNKSGAYKYKRRKE